MDEFLQKLQDKGREEGIETGEERGVKKTLRSVIFNLLAKGFPLETIAELVSLSLAEVQALAAEAAAKS